MMLGFFVFDHDTEFRVCIMERGEGKEELLALLGATRAKLLQE